MKIGRITLLDPRSPAGETDKLAEDIDKAIARVFDQPSEIILVLVQNREELRAAMIRLCDVEKCPLVVTTGGTGPGPLDIVPEITQELLDRELPGFGETIRHYSFMRTPIALLSRAVAGVRGQTLVLNLPSRPKPILGLMKLLREAIVECLEQVTGVRYKLWVNEIEIPLEKWLPWLRRFRVKPDPRFE
jgi:molybdopterin adenylyltransferase